MMEEYMEVKFHRDYTKVNERLRRISADESLAIGCHENPEKLDELLESHEKLEIDWLTKHKTGCFVVIKRRA